MSADVKAEIAEFTVQRPYIGEAVARLMGHTAEDEKAHPLCQQIRNLRRAAGLTLTTFEERSGIPAVVCGAYERGDRQPPLHKLDAIFDFFGYRLVAVPKDAEAVRVSEDMVADLRAIADQLAAAGHPSVGP